MNDVLALQEVPAALKKLTNGEWDIQYRQVQKYAASGKLVTYPFGGGDNQGRRYKVFPSDVEDFAARWLRGEVGKVGRPKLYRYIVATTEVDLDRERFTEDCLKAMADTPMPMPVHRDFDDTQPVGQVTSLACKNGKLLASSTAEGFAVVPMFSYDPDNDITTDDDVAVYHRVKVLGFGLTDKPSDPNCKRVG